MRFPFAALALGALVLAAPAAHAQFGIAAGANFDQLSDVDTGSREATFKNATGYHVGLFVDLPLGPVALRPGVFYTDVSEFEVEDGAGNFDRVSLDLIEVPIDVRFRIPAPVIKPYVSAGPVFRFAQNQDEDGEFEPEDFTIAAAAGAGVELSALGFRPFAEARYQFGLQDLTKEVAGFSTASGGRVNSFMIRVGLTF